MVELKDLVEFLNKEIDINSVKDKCVNGLQIEGKKTVNKIGLAVDVSLKTIRKAVDQNCDIIITHHALIFAPIQKLTGLLARRIELLMKNSISLYVAHLPLDIHKKYSHGKLIVDELGMYGVSKFAQEGEKYFGFSGHIRKKATLDQLKENIDKKLNSDSKIFNFGKKEVSSIAVVSGSGGFAIEEAGQKEIDCFITGEMKHNVLLDAKDLKINVILAGHYETEKLGMIRLSHTLTKKFKTECLFLES